MNVSFSLEAGEWCRGSYEDQQLTHFLVNAIPIFLLVSHITAERHRMKKILLVRQQNIDICSTDIAEGCNMQISPSLNNLFLLNIQGSTVTKQWVV